MKTTSGRSITKMTRPQPVGGWGYLNIVDEFTREVLVVEVARSITADKTVEVREQLVETRGLAPDLIRSDNGPDTHLTCPLRTGAACLAPEQPSSSPGLPGKALTSNR